MVKNLIHKYYVESSRELRIVPKQNEFLFSSKGAYAIIFTCKNGQRGLC